MSVFDASDDRTLPSPRLSRSGQLKAEIREVRQLLASETDPDEIRELEWDLEELIDKLCIEFPDDRECKKE